jgi:hypothetical protein
MKRLFNMAAFLTFVGAQAFFTGCSGDDDDGGSVTDQQIEQLSGTWKATSVTLDDAQQEGYEEFTLKIFKHSGEADLGYIITNNPDESPWLSEYNGVFVFDTGEPTKYFLREDDVRIEYNVSGESLALLFNYEEPATGGRVDGVSGEWEFVFAKQSE